MHLKKALDYMSYIYASLVVIEQNSRDTLVMS